MMAESNQKQSRIKKRYENMKAERSPWDNKYDQLARFILGRNNYCTRVQLSPEDFFDPWVFDDTAFNANALLASSNVGALWPSGGKSFYLEAPYDPSEPMLDSEEVKLYYERASKTVVEVMDNPRAGFPLALEEYELEKGALGTAAIFVEDNDDDYLVPVNYRAINTRDLYIDVNSNNMVDTVYLRRDLTLNQIADAYGTDTFNESEMKELENHDWLKRYEIVIAIEPRKEYNPNSRANTDFPYSSCHVDITRNKVLKESGYKEMPIFVGRFWHMLNEKYGRSPGMNALPSIRELNQLRYLTIEAGEKLMKPPINVIEGSVVGNDEVDTSAGGLNVVSVSGKLANYSGKPIEQTLDIHDPQWAFQRLAELVEIVKNHFFQDRIMDLNNEQRMTLGEANIRNKLRGQSLNTVYTRDYREVVQPTIERTFNILFGKNMLGIVRGSREEAELIANGVVPFYIPDVLVDRIMKGKDIYKIKFISPAQRIMESEELTGMQEALELALGVQPGAPDIMDNYDTDFIAHRSTRLTGGPALMIRSKEAIAKIRQQRAQQQQEALQAQTMQMNAATAKDAATAQAQMENT